jgi:septal ring factor EnvC (AmiA/AmiB activator)
MRVPAALLAALLAAAAAAAQTPPPDPEEAERLERESATKREEAARLAADAEAVAAEIARLQAELVEAARDQARTEEDAAAASRRLDDLSGEEERLRAAIAADREALIDTVAALQRLERGRPPTIVAEPGDAAAAARAAMLLASAAPAIEAQADAARRRIVELQTVRRDIDGERTALAGAESEIADRRRGIVALLDEKRLLEARLRQDAAAEARAARELAARAADIRDRIRNLEYRAALLEPRLKPGGGRPGSGAGAAGPSGPAPVVAGGRFAEARGALTPPALGRIAAKYGENRDGGPLEGIILQTRRRAQVISPYDAYIEFSGEFRGYGQLLLLNVGDGYHIVLAGLSAVYGVTGQSVLAGEPLGEMGDGGRAGPELYVEFRKDGETIDPAPWLRE